MKFILVVSALLGLSLASHLREDEPNHEIVAGGCIRRPGRGGRWWHQEEEVTPSHEIIGGGCIIRPGGGRWWHQEEEAE